MVNIRRRAIQDVLADFADEGDNRSCDKLDTLRRASMASRSIRRGGPVRTLRQMFVDASNTKRIESNTLSRDSTNATPSIWWRSDLERIANPV